MSAMKHIVQMSRFAVCCLVLVQPLRAADQETVAKISVDKEPWTFSGARGRPVLEYCPNASPMKPYVKKLYTPNGVQVLRDSPPDHKHHHGLMFALGVNGVDFWGEEKGAGRESLHGDPRVESNDNNFTRGGQCIGSFWSGCMLPLDWFDAKGKKLLVEERTIGFVPPSRARPVTLVIWSSELAPAEGLASIKFDGHHYYGLGMRFVESMDSGGRFFNSSGKPGELVRGSERLVPAKWAAYTAKADGKRVTVAIFDHPANPRHPNKMFTMSPPFAYLSATLNLWKEPLVLKAGEKLKLKYAVALWDGETPAEQVEALYQKWAGEK
jgi:hypothetical protein